MSRRPGTVRFDVRRRDGPISDPTAYSLGCAVWMPCFCPLRYLLRVQTLMQMQVNLWYVQHAFKFCFCNFLWYIWYSFKFYLCALLKIVFATFDGSDAAGVDGESVNDVYLSFVLCQQSTGWMLSLLVLFFVWLFSACMLREYRSNLCNPRMRVQRQLEMNL